MTLRRPLLAVPLAAVALLPGAAHAADRPAPSSVSRTACTTSATDAQGRAVDFVVRMSDMSAPSLSYGFRLRLQERAPGGSWRTLRRSELPAGFQPSQTARAGTRRMVRRIGVRGLRPGAAYRVRVTFRWLRPNGDLRTGSTTSRACRVEDLRPNLAVGGGLAWTPAPTAGEVVYRVPMRTERPAALGGRPVVVAVLQDGVELGRTEIAPVGGDEVVLVPGRRCASDRPLRVVADPDGAVDERDEDDNAVRAACPASAG
ncbi:hypothetical protein SK069_07410 [Patulibacter brassicae]|uniref:CARDB domain-containing protein n=1 Tax=Patulibacter brassicae TaxID=1705717 RepID=A0ABU4VKN5_9ACTN|nr:hypothetical protein [Patulibacter brassicae]MDX8151413.1 hypothetical protein [Patulibacter brassicae]